MDTAGAATDPNSTRGSRYPCGNVGFILCGHDRQPVGALQGLDPERVVYFDWSSTLDQLTLAEFIARTTDVCSMRLRDRRRRDELVAAVAQRAPGIRVTGMAAALQLVVEPPRGVTHHLFWRR